MNIDLKNQRFQVTGASRGIGKAFARQLSEYGDDFALKDIALNELTKPEDIAPLIALLCSGLADHATGTTIDFNAGSYVH